MKGELISIQYIKSILSIKGKELKFLEKWFVKIFKINEFNSIYSSVKQDDGIDFIKSILDHQNIKLQVSKRDNHQTFPKKKGFIVVSNHPLGILDGLLLLKILIPIRDDIKIVVNQELKLLTQIHSYFLPVDQNKKSKTHRARFTEAKKIMKHLKEGKPLIFFPATSVSQFKPLKLRIEDKKWDSTCLKVLSKSDVPVYPIAIDGRTSLMYQILLFLHKKLSFFWLITEFVNTKNKSIALTIKKPKSVFALSNEEIEKTLKKAIYKS